MNRHKQAPSQAKLKGSQKLADKPSKAERLKKMNKDLDEELKETFPASDPITKY